MVQSPLVFDGSIETGERLPAWRCPADKMHKKGRRQQDAWPALQGANKLHQLPVQPLCVYPVE